MHLNYSSSCWPSMQDCVRFPKAPVVGLNFRPGLIFKSLDVDSYDFEGIVEALMLRRHGSI